MGEQEVQCGVLVGMSVWTIRCIKRVLIPEGRGPINLLETLKSFFTTTTPVSSMVWRGHTPCEGVVVWVQLIPQESTTITAR